MFVCQGRRAINQLRGILAMPFWILLATRWRADGTPRPDRNFLSAVQHGDPLAMAILVVVLISAVASTLYQFFHKR